MDDRKRQKRKLTWRSDVGIVTFCATVSISNHTRYLDNQRPLTIMEPSGPADLSCTLIWPYYNPRALQLKAEPSHIPPHSPEPL